MDFPSTWSRLLKTCQEVIRVSDLVDKREWNDRFSDVYKLCVAFPEPLGDKLYAEIRSFLHDHVSSLYEDVIDNSYPQGTRESLLICYHSHWLRYKQGVSYLNKLYMYLNTQHIKKQKVPEQDITYGMLDFNPDSKLEIGELGLHLWRQNMIEPLKDQLVTLLLEAIANDRRGNPSNESVIQGVILSLVEVEEYKKKGSLELYQKVFETPFLKSTGDHYKQEADILLQGSDVSSYMERVLMRIDAENVRSRKYLHCSSYSRVTAECQARMVADHLSVLHSESKTMVAQDRRRDLGNMYRLLKPIDKGLVILIKDIQDHITRTGLEAVNNIPSTGDNMAQVFVEMVLDVHQKYSDLIRDVFNSDQQFASALDKACSCIVNHRKNAKLPCKSPELLARYCDSLLKKSLKGTTENEIDDKLSLSITVFKYIDDKDVFQKFYAKMFAKRLIHSQSLSMESEEGMINKLKNACGYEFTSKLHRMFTDIKLSDDLNEAFTSWQKEEKVDFGSGLSFNIFVLQAGAWPLGQSAISPFALPQPLERPVSHFETFYGRKFNGRKLTWLHHLSSTDVKMSFPDNKSSGRKTYIASMGTYHMAILYIFETSESLTFKELCEHTKLSEDQLVKHLQSLIEAKLILVPELTAGRSLDCSSPTAHSPSPPSPSCREESSKPLIPLLNPSPSTTFKLNLDFSNKRTKFKITAVSQKEVPQVSLVIRVGKVINKFLLTATNGSRADTRVRRRRQKTVSSSGHRKDHEGQESHLSQQSDSRSSFSC